MKIALAGNPNSGKTTLFNDLTGENQYVGNWPGVTVERKEGPMRTNPDVIVQDLPGIYSLSPYRSEELITRKYLVEDRPDAIIDIIDATCIDRSLYLTTQLLELGIPVVIALNMMDMVEKNGDSIDMEKLAKELRCPVVPITALRKCGCIDAAKAAIALVEKNEKKEAPHIYSGEVEHTLAHIEESIDGIIPDNVLRWYAIKIFERDPEVIKELGDRLKGEHTNRLEGHPNADHTHPSGPDFDLREHLDEHIRECEEIMEDDSESIIINERYDYIAKVCDKAVERRRKVNELSISDKIDRIVTHRIWALPIFAVVMFLVYYVSITLLGTITSEWTKNVLFGSWIQPGIRTLLESAGASNWVVTMIADGVMGGLAVSIGFAPQMAIVFLFISFLQDCGYMSRVAFVMDRAFRKFGLSGTSFIPFLISSGCGVPGIMGTRAIQNVKDRRITMIVTTMIPCGAKMPVIAAIAGYIAGGLWWLAPAMYFAGVGMVIVCCLILKKTKNFGGEPAPFVMELPAYQMPLFKHMLLHTWESVSEFLKKAGTVLFICCAVMWMLSNFGWANGSFGLVSATDSLMSRIGGVLAPIFVPLGFGNWQAVAATLSGFVAKECIVSTMGVLAGVSEAAALGGAAFTGFLPNSMAAVSFLMLNLFVSPCCAAVSTMAKEMGNRKYFWFAVAFQNLMGYSVALIVYQIGGLIIGMVPFTWMTIFAALVLAYIIWLIVRPMPGWEKK